MALLGLQKTVLVLSDEAVAVYTPVRGRFSFLGEVRWQDAEFTTALAELLSLKGRSRPIMILYDMVEQYYRKEIVPKVAVLDQRRVLERRLTAAFNNYPLRASLPLKVDKKGAVPVADRGERTKSLDGIPYLFAALPDHDQMNRVIEAVRYSMTVVRSLTLLPIESVSMVRQLSNNLNENTASSERWTVFIAQHRGGGLRQIVVRNGELALTRLTPIVDTDIEPNIWANEVVQEFSATMGYLSRFGYNSNSELEIIVLGNPEAVKSLQPQLKATSFHGLTVYEAARALRLNIDVDDETRYADVLHVAWLARKMRVTLPFKIKELSFISTARTLARAAASFLILGAVGSMGYVGYQGWTLIEKQKVVAGMKTTLSGLEQEYNAELDRKKEFNIDVKLVQGSIAIFDDLEKGKVDILPFLQGVSAAMTPELSFDKIEMSYQIQQQENPDPMAIQTVQKKEFMATLELSFPPSLKPELGNKIVSDLRDRIAQNLSNFVIFVVQPVRDMTFKTEFSYKTGQDVDENSTRTRLTAIIGIKQRVAPQ